MGATLTLEALLNGRWRRAAILEFPEESSGDRGLCHFEYEHAFLDECLVDPVRPDAQASLRLPLEFGPSTHARWPSFLDDATSMARSGSIRGRTNPTTPPVTCW